MVQYMLTESQAKTKARETNILSLGEPVLLQALLYLPSLEVCCLCRVCKEWSDLLGHPENIFGFWRQLGSSHDMGLIAEGRLWLHTIATLPSIAEVCKETKRCILVGTSWLCSFALQRLFKALQKNDRPWNPIWGSCDGDIILTTWTFGFFETWIQPAASFCNLLQLADLFSINGQCIWHLRSKPLRLNAGGISFDVHLNLCFLSAEESRLSWSAVCSVDPIENDIELELSGCLVSPCHAEIRPFGVLGQKSDDFLLDEVCHSIILHSLFDRIDLVCLLRAVFRYKDVEYDISVALQ